MKKGLPIISISILFYLLQACSTNKAPYYGSDHKNWETSAVNEQVDINHSVYLIGETGGAKTLSPALKLLQQQALKDGKNSTVVFLGNQVYPAGVPEETDENYTAAIQSLNQHLNPFLSYKGNLFLLSGDKDWDNDGENGLEKVQRQEEIAEQILNGRDAFLPSNGCGDPIEIKLTDNLMMLVLNSQWWARQGEENGANIGCDVANEIEFLEAVEEILADNQGKNILIAMHHPIYSSGKYGGYYPWKDHIFPLTSIKENLYIPLPIIGSSFPLSKKILGNRQDLTHPQQLALKKGLTDILKDYEDVVIVSGHEPGLQYFYKKLQHFLVSGGGGPEDYVKKRNSAEFAYQKNGFLKLNYLENEEVWMEFWTTEDGGKVVFRKKLFSKPPPVFKEEDYQSIQKKSAKTIATNATNIYDAKGFKRLWFGDHFRDEWGTEVTVPIVFLDTLKGGLTPVKKGGGFQTKSLRLEAADGKQYNLRTINKDATKVVPYVLRGTFTQNIIQDGISAAHPYGAYVIPDLADAAGIYHTNPQLFYVPPQAALGKFNDDFGNKLFLFEERPSGDWSDNPDFGNSKEIIGAKDLIKKLKKNNNSEVDQDYVLKARLFDILIGDWDRHDDQWRWASFEKDNKTIYRPIPRDRDQVFYRFDGILPFIVGRPFITPQFRSFDEKIDYLPGLVYNARNFDRANLNKKTKAEFIQMATELQTSLTDEVIATAFKKWSPAIYELNGEDIIGKLKTRRKNLVEIATQYYHFLAQEPDVVGTNDPELFEVTRLDDRLTKVQVYDLSNDGKELVYNRTFDNRETKEIRLYGQKGDDIFKIDGVVKKGIKILIIGGGGEDRVEEQSSVNGSSKKTIVYDKPKGLTIATDNGAIKNKAVKEKGINKYDRFGYLYDKKIGFPLIAINPDAGLGLGYFTIIQKQGFRTRPYRSQHTISGSFAFSTDAGNLNYSGHFPNALGKADLRINASGTGPTFITNYFGLGNTIPDTEEDLAFHRVEGTRISFHPAIYKDFGEVHSLQIGPSYDFYKVEQTEDRFVNTTDANLLAEDFNTKHYIGFDATYECSLLDNPVLPLRGYRFQLGTEYRLNTADSDNNFTRFHGDLALYVPFNVQKSVVIATKLGAAYNAGTYEFFQANQLGGNSQVRGFNTGKFAGDGIFYHATDLRIALGQSKSTTFPFTWGIHASYDYGRTWLAEEQNNNIWHSSVGGGLFFLPLNLFAFRVSYFTSSDDSIFSIGGGFSF